MIDVTPQALPRLRPDPIPTLPRETTEGCDPAPTLTRHEDGTITIDGFPPRIPVVRDLLTTASYGLEGHADGRITITCANGTATYRAVAETHPEDPAASVLICERVEGRLIG
ncbi:MAG TPA: hypothetical protein VNP72_09635 [Longimicrobium sp.]|nr:hypothetical protein [Longimicrobium sp.]